MKVLLITPADKAGLAIYRSLQRQDLDVVWYSGVFHDLWKYLDQGYVYMYRVIPDNLGEWGTPEKVMLSEVSIAFVEESRDGAEEGVYGHTLAGSYKGWNIVEPLTAAGVVCIGFSKREDCFEQFTTSGAVATLSKDKMTHSLRPVLTEARRLVFENSLDSPGMKALTLRQPWAWATMTAGKDIENRVWPAKVRGTIAIHASEEVLPHVYTAASDFIAQAVRKRGKRFFEMPSLSKMPKSAIVGVVDLIEVVTSHDSPWFEGPLGFVLTNPRPLPEPIACPGQRRFFTLPKGIERKIRRQLGL